MAKTVRNVMSSVSKEKQLKGMTLGEIRTEFMLAGYGVTKATKRTKELLESAQIQTDGRRNENGGLVFFCIYWPFTYTARILNLDLSRVCAVEYLDARHNELRRIDGKVNAWDLTESL